MSDVLIVRMVHTVYNGVDSSQSVSVRVAQTVSNIGGGGGNTNLSYTPASSQGTVTSDTGTDATIPAVDNTNAGLMTPTQKSKLDGIEANADVTDATNVSAAGAFMKSTDDTDDITVGTTNKFATQTEKDKLSNITITQPVDLDAIETRVNELDAAVILKGTWDASAGTFPGGGAAQAGWSYIVSVAGTVGGVSFAVNDRLIAIVDNASTTTFASNWFKADYTDLVTSVDGATGAITVGAIIAAASTKDTIADTDKFGFSDSESSDATKKTAWSNIKSKLNTYFSTIYAAISHTHTSSNITDFASAVSSNTDVAANTAARHAAVTVVDTDDIDLVLSGQQISATIKATAISSKTSDTLTGTEEVLLNDAGTLKKSTVQSIADLASASGTVIVFTDQTPDNGAYGTLAGSVNSSNKVFTVSQGSYISGRIQVYRNGQLQSQGATDDYTETAPNSGTFTFNDAPLTGDTITAVYQKAVVSLDGGNLSGSLNFAKGSDIASASTTDIASATGNYVVVSGNSSITALGTAQAGSMRILRCTGTPTFVHNATTLILPGSNDIIANVGDFFEFISEGSGNWRLIRYVPSQNTPISTHGQIIAKMSGKIMF